MYINNLGHMTKMAAMPIYSENPSKIFFSDRLISRKLGMKHRWLKCSNVHVYMGHYQKMEQSRKAKRKKLIVHFFFFNGIVLLTGAYRI